MPTHSASSCPSTPDLTSKVISKTQAVPDNEAAVITAVRSDNTPIATLDIPANTVSAVTFIVSPVADSVLQAGSFSALFLSGKLRSQLVSITPNAIVDTRTGSITLNFVVDVPAVTCVNATANMKVVLGDMRV